MHAVAHSILCIFLLCVNCMLQTGISSDTVTLDQYTAIVNQLEVYLIIYIFIKLNM